MEEQNREWRTDNTFCAGNRKYISEIAEIHIKMFRTEQDEVRSMERLLRILGQSN